MGFYLIQGVYTVEQCHKAVEFLDSYRAGISLINRARSGIKVSR